MAENTSSKINLSGLLTVRASAEAKETILASMKSNKALKIEIAGDSEVDIAGIQLILAARAYASGNSKQLSLDAPISGRALSVMEQGGFLAGMSAEDRRFWLHEGA